MSMFIINTPMHKRWWLPDARHQYDGQVVGLMYHWYINDSVTNERRQSGSIECNHPDFDNLVSLTQELARKRYPRPLRHKKNEGIYKARGY